MDTKIAKEDRKERNEAGKRYPFALYLLYHERKIQGEQEWLKRTGEEVIIINFRL